MQAHTITAEKALSDDILYPTAFPFILFHLAALAVIWTGFTTTSVILCIALYWLRVFGITMGYHRYFSHRSFKTGRVFQFFLAFWGTAAMQRDVLWWAAKHRAHHRDSDTPSDGHSPRHYGFLGAHVTWIFRPRRLQADMNLIQDFVKYPEIRWLQENQYAPGLLMALFCFALDGLPGLFAGFTLSTILVYHSTFAINSLAHVLGKQRYLTGDDSRNHWFLAFIAGGEGWHNNHHYYPGSARNGFFWYEWDPTYYLICLFEKLGVVWEVQRPPQSVLSGEKRTTNAIIDKTAGHIASGFSVDGLVAQVRQAWANSNHWEELKARAQQAMAEAETYLHSIELPALPSPDEVRAKARKMFANTPSLDEAVERARARLVQAVSLKLMEHAKAQLPA
ncbi:MAG: acyl-CoA desaturase [Nevskiales bacterium]